MKKETFQINIEDFLKYSMKKWKIFIAVIAVSCALFVSLIWILCKVTEYPASEDYIYYKEKVDSLQEYIDHSELMKMDATAINERTIFVSNIFDIHLLEDYINTGQVWGSWAEEIPVQCLTELVKWERQDSINEAKIIVRHSTEEGCTKYAEHLKERLYDFDRELELFLGEKTVVADTTILDTQALNDSLMTKTKSSMNSANKGYRENISLISAAVFGTVIGGMAAAVAVFFNYTFTRKIRNVGELERYTQTKVIGKRGNSVRELLIPEITSPVFAAIVQSQGDTENACIIVNMTDAKLELPDFEEVNGNMILQDEQVYTKAVSAGGVIIAAAIEKTGYKDLECIVEFFRRNDIKIIGCIAC